MLSAAEVGVGGVLASSGRACDYPPCLRFPTSAHVPEGAGETLGIEAAQGHRGPSSAL